MLKFLKNGYIFPCEYIMTVSIKAHLLITLHYNLSFFKGVINNIMTVLYTIFLNFPRKFENRSKTYSNKSCRSIVIQNFKLSLFIPEFGYRSLPVSSLHFLCSRMLSFYNFSSNISLEFRWNDMILVQTWAAWIFLNSRFILLIFAYTFNI